MSQPVSILSVVQFETSVTLVSLVPVVVESGVMFCGTGEVSAALMVQVFRVVTLRDRGIR